MRIHKLDHVAIVSADPEASRNWYVNTLEMEWIYKDRWDNNPIFLRKGDAFIAIFRKQEQVGAATASGSGINHFAFRAESMADYNSVKSDLTGKGIPFEEQDHEISMSLYMVDPDGITVEITTYDRG